MTRPWLSSLIQVFRCETVSDDSLWKVLSKFYQSFVVFGRPEEGICLEFEGSPETSGHPGWLAQRQKQAGWPKASQGLERVSSLMVSFLLRLLRNVASTKLVFVEKLFPKLSLVSRPLKPFNQHASVTGLNLSAGAPAAEIITGGGGQTGCECGTLIRYRRGGFRGGCRGCRHPPVNTAAACSVDIRLLNVGENKRTPRALTCTESLNDSWQNLDPLPLPPPLRAHTAFSD